MCLYYYLCGYHNGVPTITPNNTITLNVGIATFSRLPLVTILASVRLCSLSEEHYNWWAVVMGASPSLVRGGHLNGNV